MMDSSSNLRPAALGSSGRRAQAFAHDFSLEATRPKAAEIEALRAILRPGTAVYLSAVPARPAEEQAEAAMLVRAAGFEPVPHIAARRYPHAAALSDMLSRLRSTAGVRRVLVVAGDDERPAGAFASALAAIDSGLFGQAGIEEIGIAGYPDGHPRMSEPELDRALAAKIAAAERAGLRLCIVTQFCFEPERIVAWLRRLRGQGIGVPVRVGMVGPTSLMALISYARRCGVRTSARGLAQRPGALGALMGDHGPEEIIRALLAAPDEIGEISPHFFSFGGILKTAQFARTAGDSVAALARSEEQPSVTARQMWRNAQ